MNGFKSGDFALFYENDIAISPSARIGINGYDTTSALGELRKKVIAIFSAKQPKGEHINLVSIVKEMTQEELEEIKQVVERWKEKYNSSFVNLEFPFSTTINGLKTLPGSVEI